MRCTLNTVGFNVQVNLYTSRPTVRQREDLCRVNKPLWKKCVVHLRHKRGCGKCQCSLAPTVWLRRGLERLWKETPPLAKR